jgi:hypothetical protein
MLTPGKEHCTVFKRVFKYLCGTKYYDICYQGKPGCDRELNVYGFVDPDWDEDLDRQRSTSGYVFKMFGRDINWMSKRQSIVSLSTIEVEYMEVVITP